MTLEERERKLKQLINAVDDRIPAEYALDPEDMEALKILSIKPDRSSIDYDKALRVMFLWGWSRGAACVLNEMALKC